jgi:translation initiation factor 1
MPEVCTNCGLPKELCVCKTIDRESQQIRVYVDRRRFGKFVTIVEGIDEAEGKQITSKLKSKLACGGTYKNDEVELQGDHRDRVKEILIKEGFPKDIIEIS